VKPRVLHVLSQRPSLTGSGVTLDALARRAACDWEQAAVIGVPAGDPVPAVGELAADRIHTLRFGAGGALEFPVPGMSDVMPYRSTVFSSMDDDQLGRYRAAWRTRLADAIASFRPHLIHANHVWLVASMLKDVAPDVPVVNHSHATGLRQRELCPHLADEVARGCRRNDAFAVIHAGIGRQLRAALGVPRDRIHVVGPGYRDELFHARGRGVPGGQRLLYIGKYAAAKGLPWLLDAVETLRAGHPDLELHVAGGGAGAEADALRARMEAMAPAVVLHGMVTQPDLATLMRTCHVCALPSFYEGVPLVLAEALACGCRVVSTALPGVVDELAPRMGVALQTVALPRLDGVDTPRSRDLPAFVVELAVAIERSLVSGEVDAAAEGVGLDELTWGAVYGRVSRIWTGLLSCTDRR
jgi:glycosyltransferase involved in cell wall biosynthesis